MSNDTGDQNLAILIGTLSFDGEQRETKTGKPVCSLKMETRDEYGREGHRLVWWNTLPPGMVAGARVRAEGKITTRKWKDKQGVEVATVEVKCTVLRLVADHEAPLPPEVRALAAGVAPGLAANLPAVEPGELPTVFGPFGRSKNRPIAGASAGDLEWYLGAARRNLSDPFKARWRRSDEAMVKAIEAELDAQREYDACGGGGRNPGAAAMREGGPSDPLHPPSGRQSAPMWGPGEQAEEDDIPFARPVQPSRMARLL